MEQIPSPTIAPRIKFARAIVFYSSFCLMTIEILASRVLAPYLGVSLYTWTSVIAVILCGVSCGNFAGGRVADKGASKKTLGLAFALAGGTALASFPMTAVVGPYLSGAQLPIWLATVIFCLAVFFPTAFFLSMVSPQVVKFDLHDLEKAGATVGTLGAWSAIGSILGTLATGFVFIMYFGTRILLAGIACSLVLLGVIIAWQDKIWKTRLAIIFLGLLAVNSTLPNLCETESNYFCIRATEVALASGVPSYRLNLDHLVHSVVTPTQLDRFGYDYELIQAGLVAYQFKPDDTFRTLTIGAGGYSMPRYLEAAYPKATVDVIEIDPAVTTFNHEKLFLPQDTRIRSFHEDARQFLLRMKGEEKYDLIYGDAVNDFAPPFQITTREFQTLVREHLTPTGRYAITIIDDPSHGSFLAALTRTLRQVFPVVDVFALGSNLEFGAGRNTFELVAGFEPLDAARWRESRPTMLNSGATVDEQKWIRTQTRVTSEQLEKFLASRAAPALTDDYAPVDQYLAPLFRDAFAQ